MRTAGIQSIEDALLLLKRGRHFVVCSPSHDTTSHIFQRALARFPKRKIVSFSSAEHGKTVELASEDSVPKILHRIKRTLKDVPRDGFLLIDIAENHPSLFSSLEKQRQVLGTILKLCREQDIPTAWFVRRNALLSDALAMLKNESDFFLQISRVGTLTIAQFIHARDISDAQFFLPRILSLTSTSSVLSLPVVPSNAPLSPVLSESNAEDLVERQYHSVFDAAPDPMILFELWGDYKEFNTRAKEALGYEESELASLSLRDIVVSEKIVATIRSLLLLKRKGKLRFTTQVKRKSGRLIDVELSASLLVRQYVPSGRTPYGGKSTFVAVCNDTSERVKADAEAKSLTQEYASFVASTPYPFAIFIHRKLASHNATFDALFPFAKESVPSLSDFFGKRNSELLKEIGAMLDGSSHVHAMQNREVLIPTPDRQTVAVEVSLSVIRYEGKQAVYCTFVDVSARRRVRDQAEATEEKFMTLVEQSLDALSISHEETFILLNKRFAEMFGYDSTMELLGKVFTSVVARGNSRTQVLENLKEVGEGKDASRHFEYIGLKKDGTKIFVAVQVSRISFEEKPALLAYHRDITQLRNAEGILERKANALGILNRMWDEIDSTQTLDEIHQRGLSAALKGMGFETGALLLVDKKTATLTMQLRHNLSDTVCAKLASQSTDESFVRYFNKTHEPVVVLTADYPPHLPFKALFESEQYRVLAFLPLIMKKEFYGILFLATEKERALDDHEKIVLSSLARQFSSAIDRARQADQTRQTEEKFTTTIENISDVLYELQPDGTFNFVTPNIEKLIGFRPNDFMTNANLWRTLLHPDDRPMVSQRISHQARDIQQFQLEYRILPKGKASYIWLRDAVRYVRAADGSVSAISGIIADITAEKKLAALSGGAATLPDRQGRVSLEAEGVAAFQKNLEQEVTESEELLRNVINTMGDALMISDFQGKVWEVNREFTRLTGYERNEARSVGFPYPWLYVGEVTQFIRWMTELLDKEHLHDLDMTWLHKQGHHVAVSLSTTMLRDAGGNPMAILNIARDITERRKLSVELAWKNRQIELLNRIISYANTTMDLEMIFSTIATEIFSLTPFDGIAIALDEGEGTLSQIYLGVLSEEGACKKVEQLALNDAIVEQAIESRKTAVNGAHTSGDVKAQISIPLFVQEKMLGVFTLVAHRENAFAGDEVSFLQPVADQVGTIVERVRLFEQVKEDSAYIHNLLNSINHVVCTVDKNYRITDVNNAWGEFMRRQGLDEWANEESIVGQSLEVIMPNDASWAHYRRVMEDLFARRVEYYSGNAEITTEHPDTAYHLLINPMVIQNKVTALVLTLTDITEINRSEAEIRQRNKELIALNTISTSISKSLQLDEVLLFAAEQVRETFDGSVVTFHLLHEDPKELLLAGQSGLSPAAVESVRRVSLETTLAGEVMASRKAAFIAHHPEASERMIVARTANAKSVAVIPLQLQGKGSGILTVCFLQHHEFTEKEQQLLILIGNQLSSAIENAQLYSEIQQQVKTLTTLYEMGKELTGVLNLDSVLKAVYREVAKTLPLDRFYYQSYSPEHHTLSLLSRMVDGNAEFYPSDVKVRNLDDWPNTIYQDVVLTGKSYHGSTTGTDSMVAVPIKTDESLVGIISIVSSKPKAYNPVHLRLLESIANLTGIAIGKATLYEDTLKKTREIENRNKELDDFSYVVSHDLKEPLISIEGYSKIVMKEYGEMLGQEGKEYLGTIVLSTTRMKHLIEDLLMLSRVGRMKEALESVPVRRTIDEILYDLQFSLKEKNVVVTVADTMPVVRYNGTRLNMVFRNLISNAMKFNDKPNPTIDIRMREEENEFVFSVEDNGIGIESQYFDRIFAIFQRLKRSDEYRGTGAGLTITKRIIEREGGRIWVESEPGKGATFLFTIKKAA